MLLWLCSCVSVLMFNVSGIRNAADLRWEARIFTFENEARLVWVVLFAAQRTTVCTKFHSLYCMLHFLKNAMSRQTQYIDLCLMVNRKTFFFFHF